MYQYAQIVHYMQHPGVSLLPPSVDIDLTNACNQDCYYCESATFRQDSPGARSLDDYLTLLDRLASWKQQSNVAGSVHTVCFSGGGEPTLFKGYEQVIKRAVNSGFMTSLITNGTNLDRLLDSLTDTELQQLAWIGVDIDAGTEELYEQIRKTKTKSIFSSVVNSMQQLSSCGVNIDIKILLNEFNSNTTALRDMFELARTSTARMLYFRPTVINGVPYSCTHLDADIVALSKEYNIPATLNLKKFQPRTYSRCHQMYAFLTFCADGNMYSCCENKGNPMFSLGSWVEGDFRKLWDGKQHKNMYNSINTNFCPVCRGNTHNIEMEKVIQNPGLKDMLFL